MAEQAIIDFIIVVLGILFALFINKLNEKRNHTKRINNIMTIVISNFNNSLSLIDRIIEGLEKDMILYKEYVNAEKPKDKIMQSVYHIPISMPLFQADIRGYNLLKDARVDFEFKDSHLISDIVHFYSFNIKNIDNVQSKMMDNCENNTRELSFLSFFELKSEKGELLNKECFEYMKTGEYKQRLVYAHFMRGIFKRELLFFKEKATALLDRVMESDYK